MGRFVDRADAGRELAKALRKYKGAPAVVYALPRGGVVPGLEVARALDLPFDLVIARKIGSPQNPEYAIAAIAEDGDMVEQAREVARVDAKWFEQACKKQQEEAKRRRETYVGGRPSPSVEGKTALVVDDGIATGLTMSVVLKEIRHKKPAKIVIAVPVTSQEAEKKFAKDVDEFVALEHELTWGAIGSSYDDFPQVEDQEVVDMIKRFDQERKSR